MIHAVHADVGRFQIPAQRRLLDGGTDFTHAGEPVALAGALDRMAKTDLSIKIPFADGSPHHLQINAGQLEEPIYQLFKIGINMFDKQKLGHSVLLCIYLHWVELSVDSF